MKVHFRSNLDLYNEEWPDELPAVPNVGDLVQSAREHKGNYILELQVCRVIWRPVAEFGKGVTHWRPEIELNVPPNRYQSLTHFDLWYEYICGKIDEETYKRRLGVV